MTRAVVFSDYVACLVLTLVALAALAGSRGNAQAIARPQRLFRNSNRAPANSSSTQQQQQSAAIKLNAENSIDELPADFEETPVEQLDLGANATGRAPNPILDVAVLQNGQRIDSAINVHPGTPLEMIIYLDNKSAKVYGLHASSLRVQDNTVMQREQPIISNGCSIETNIFGNFELNEEDKSLRAKFRAFKFPESSFVRFVGTVNVCIKQCEKPNCSSSSSAGALSSTSKFNSSLQKTRNNSQLRKKRASSGKQQGKELVLTVSTLLRIGDSSATS